MNKHAIVILYSGSDREPGYDVIEALANVITAAKISVPELVEIKHFDSDSVGKAIIAKAVSVETPVDREDELLKQSVVYIVEKYKNIPESKRGIAIFKDAIRAKQYIDDDSKAFNRAMDTIISHPESVKRLGMGRRFIDMLIYAKENVSNL